MVINQPDLPRGEAEISILEVRNARAWRRQPECPNVKQLSAQDQETGL